MLDIYVPLVVYKIHLYYIIIVCKSHPKFYKKTYVECKIIQTSLGNYIFQTITSNFVTIYP